MQGGLEVSLVVAHRPCRRRASNTWLRGVAEHCDQGCFVLLGHLDNCPSKWIAAPEVPLYLASVRCYVAVFGLAATRRWLAVAIEGFV